MIKSMTGFASGAGTDGPYTWTWEVRSVNGRGLDLRLRVPDWVEGLEAGLRSRISGVAARGSVTCNLRLSRDEVEGTLQVNDAHLSQVLAALHQIEDRAMDEGLSLAPSKATDIASIRGVLEQAAVEEDTTALSAQLLSAADAVLGDFDAMRQAEGAALAEILGAQLEEVAVLVQDAKDLAEARREEAQRSLRAALARVVEHADGADPDRVAQELALIAVKADITEELDRLDAHVVAAKDLLAGGGPVGRKLDFLMQEFNREANTLCSKAQMKGMTALGLALKAVIDQMREQVQNVE